MVETGVFAGFNVYVKNGTAFGNEANMGLWSLASTGTLTANGLDVPSPVALGSDIDLDANTLYGIALVMPAEAGHDYTGTSDPPSVPVSYTNADLALAFGTASNEPFTDPISDPRVWNGTISYEIDGSESAIPEPATMGLLGLALGGLGLLRRRQRA